MTLITGPTAISVGDELYAYSQRIDFSAFASGAEATGLDFTSPNDHYSCILNVSLDTGQWAAADIPAIILRANGENIYLAKWAVNATTVGEIVSIYPLAFILPPNTIFKAILSLSSSTAMVGSGSFIMVGRKIGGPLA